jgi:hypothetical protein
MLHCHGGDMSPTYVTVSQRGPLSLYIKLEGPINWKTNLLIRMVQPLDVCQGPLEFHGHGSWFMCRAALGVFGL